MHKYFFNTLSQVEPILQQMQQTVTTNKGDSSSLREVPFIFRDQGVYYFRIMLDLVGDRLVFRDGKKRIRLVILTFDR